MERERPSVALPGLRMILCLLALVCLPLGADEAKAVAGTADGVVDETKSAAADIAAWAAIREANGKQGRPLPLTASWVCQGMFGPQRTMAMIKAGHHVIPTLGAGPGFMARYAYILENKGFREQKLPAYMAEIEPVLKFCAEHKLPISMGGHNWATGPVRMEFDYNRAPKHNRKTFTPEESVRLMIEKDGKIQSGSWKMSSPFGPDERWREFARWWMDNPAMKRIRELYPDPPLVVWLNNNEAGEIGLKHLDFSVRFLKKHGKNLTKDDKVKTLHEAYDHKYNVLFEEARRVLIQPAWRKNTIFVAYNAWPRSVKGRTAERNRGSEWKRFDGCMPEFYLNDWQIYRGKTDYNYWSPQTEALRVQSSQDVIFGLDPDHYFASIVWDGGQPATRRSAINCLATGMYGSGAVQQWDFARYEGMVQFGLWAMRPRVMREFRWPVSEHNAYDQEAFMCVVRAVDRPWNNEVLKEFWRFGKLVKSDEFKPANEKVAGELQFYSRVNALLPVDVNPPRDKWPRVWALKAGKRPPVKMRVLALALQLGAKPKRRWLIYAHAPLGAVAGSRVMIPELGKVKLPYVARSGSFFVIDEGGGAAIALTAKTLIAGGPAEITITADKTFAKVGETVMISPEITLPPPAGFTGFTWSFGEGTEQGFEKLFGQQFTPKQTGMHLIRVTGTTTAGAKVSGETCVFVGKKPHSAVVYDLELNDASAWRGPWKGIGKDGKDLLEYRLVPNHGVAPDMVLHGGSFVKDPEAGRVLELSGKQDGLWGVRSKLTCKQGYANLTIALRFKAEDTKGTQVLYAQGGKGKGYNIYLHEGKLYGGIVSTKQWLSTDKVQAGKWHHVALVLKGAGKKSAPDRLLLYLDGEKVGSGPGRIIENHHAGPRVGICLNTTLHTGKHISGVGFRGRLAMFQQRNDARIPNPGAIGK